MVGARLLAGGGVGGGLAFDVAESPEPPQACSPRDSIAITSALEISLIARKLHPAAIGRVVRHNRC